MAINTLDDILCFLMQRNKISLKQNIAEANMKKLVEQTSLISVYRALLTRSHRLDHLGNPNRDN